MDIRLLASLYTGFLHPAQLRSVAQIDGKPEVLAAAASVFQAPEPWMADYF
jgi:predicted acetyltransferase